MKLRNNCGRFTTTYTPKMIEWLKKYYPITENEILIQKFNEKFGTNKKITAIRTYANDILNLKKVKEIRTAIWKKNCGEKNKQNKKYYTEEQNAWIISNYDKYKIADLTAEFNKVFGTKKSSLSSHIVNELGIRRKKLLPYGRNRKYSEEMTSWVVENYEKYKYNDELYSAFVKKFELDTKNYTPDSFRYFLSYTIKGKYGKERDLKDNTRAKEKLREWQKDHIKPLLSEITSNGYTYVKIANCKNQLKQRYIWEKNYGKIPTGMKVAFLDGNSQNFALDNLVLLTTSEHASFVNSGFQGDKEFAKMYVDYKKIENEIERLMK